MDELIKAEETLRELEEEGLREKWLYNLFEKVWARENDKSSKPPRFINSNMLNKLRWAK